MKTYTVTTSLNFEWQVKAINPDRAETLARKMFADELAESLYSDPEFKVSETKKR